MASTAELENSINVLSKTLDNTTAEYIKAAKELIITYTDNAMGAKVRADSSKRAELDVIQKTVSQYAELYTTIDKWNAQVKHNGAAHSDVTQSIRDQIASLAESGELTGDLKDTYDRLTRSVDGLSNRTNDLTATELAEFQDSLQRVTAAKADELHILAKSSRSHMKATVETVAGMYDFMKASKGVATILAATQQSFALLNTSMQTQVGMYSYLDNGISNMLSPTETLQAQLALLPAEMQKFVATNRQVMLSTAGAGATLASSVGDTVAMLGRQTMAGSSMMDEAYRLTGNYGDATSLMMGTVTTLQSLGVKQGFGTLGEQTEQLMRSMKGLSAVTGQSSEAIQQQLSGYFQSAEARSELLKMSDKQRRSRAAEIAKSIEYQVTLGKSTAAAIEAQKALSGIAGMGAKERMKEAAKLQAVAGAFGVEGAGRASELMRKTTRTGKEETELRNFMDTLSRSYEERRGAGGGTAMAAEAMWSKLSGQTQDIISKQNTQLDVGKSITQEQLDNAKIQTSHLGFIGQMLQDMKQLWEKNVTPILGDVSALLAGGIAGTIADIAKTLGFMYILSKAGKVSVVIKSALAALPAKFSAAALTVMPAMGAAVMGAAGVAIAAAAGAAIGTSIDRVLKSFFPDFHKGMQQVVGKAVYDGISWGEDTLSDIGKTFDSFFSEDASIQQKKADDKVKADKEALTAQLAAYEEQRKQAIETNKQLTEMLKLHKATNKSINDQTDKVVQSNDEVAISTANAVRKVSMTRALGTSG